MLFPRASKLKRTLEMILMSSNNSFYLQTNWYVNLTYPQEVSASSNKQEAKQFPLSLLTAKRQSTCTYIGGNKKDYGNVFVNNRSQLVHILTNMPQLLEIITVPDYFIFKTLSG